MMRVTRDWAVIWKLDLEMIVTMMMDLKTRPIDDYRNSIDHIEWIAIIFERFFFRFSGLWIRYPVFFFLFLFSLSFSSAYFLAISYHLPSQISYRQINLDISTFWTISSTHCSGSHRLVSNYSPLQIQSTPELAVTNNLDWSITLIGEKTPVVQNWQPIDIRGLNAKDLSWSGIILSKIARSWCDHLYAILRQPTIACRSAPKQWKELSGDPRLLIDLSKPLKKAHISMNQLLFLSLWSC